MLDKSKSLDMITKEIYSLNNLKINESKNSEIRQFIDLTINGDIPHSYLTIDANLSRNNPGIIVYILTNARLIKIDIDNKEIKSSSFLLNKIISFERKLIDGNKSEVFVLFENGSFGLQFSSTNQTIINFFQEVDKYRTIGMDPHDGK